MPANKVQLDRVISAYQQFTLNGKSKLRSDKEKLESEAELARAQKDAAKRRNAAAP